MLLAAAQERVAENKDARSQLTMVQDELEAERDRSQRVVQQLESARQQVEIRTSSANEAEHRAHALQVQVDQGAEYVAGLLEQLAAKEWQISQDRRACEPTRT